MTSLTNSLNFISYLIVYKVCFIFKLLDSYKILNLKKIRKICKHGNKYHKNSFLRILHKFGSIMG